MTTAKILVTLGNKRYVGGTITEVTGKDISGATYLIATVIGQIDRNIPPPAAAFTTLGSDVITAGTTNASRVLKRLIDTVGNYPVGTYGCWGRIADNPEVEPILLDTFTTA